MLASEIMTVGLESISSTTSLTQVARKMKSLDIGALPIVQNNMVIGIVTDRDITIRATAQGLDPRKTMIEEIMTPFVFHCYEDDDIVEAARLMEQNAIHRLLVFNRQEMPVGLISVADISVKSHDEGLTYEVIEHISEPASPHR